jgi:acetyl-CoA carboxylase carboxyltransferase component
MFELDDVIDPAETRGVIAATLRAAGARSPVETGEPQPPPHRFVDTW